MLADGNESPYPFNTSANTVISLWAPDPTLPKLSNDRLLKSVILQSSNEIKLTSNSQTQTDNFKANEFIVHIVKTESSTLHSCKNMNGKK